MKGCTIKIGREEVRKTIVNRITADMWDCGGEAMVERVLYVFSET